MNVLLDTHAFLWFVNGDNSLSETAKNYIENQDNIQYISIASLWEIAIKVSLGKLQLHGSYKNIKNQVIDNGFEFLPIHFEHTTLISSMQFHHRDPFDRLLIAQALVNNISIISKDSVFDTYSVKRIW